MTNAEKAIAYDNYIRESDKLQRENSRLKSEFTFNMPEEQVQIVEANNKRINVLVEKLKDLFR